MKALFSGKSNRSPDLLYIVTAAVILLLPVVLFQWERELRVDNRKAEKFPDVSLGKLSRFPPQFELWFGDRFGLRKNYIELGNFVLYGLFHEATCDQVRPGRGNYLFFTSHHAGAANRNSLVRALFCFDRRQAEEAAEKFLALLPKFDRSPVRVVFLTVPTKHLLDFDAMPSDIREIIPDRKHFFSTEVVREIVRRRPEAARYFADLRTEAERAAAELPLIPPGNFHWVPGPYTRLAANTVARRLGLTDEVYVPKRGDFRAVMAKSDLRYFLYRWLRTPALVTPEENFARMGISEGFEPGELLLGVVPRSKQMESFFRRSVNPAAPGGRVLIFGDSFTHPLRQDMARYCREVVSVEYFALLPLEGFHAREVMRRLIDRWRPDCIVLVSHIDATGWAEDAAEMLDEP